MDLKAPLEEFGYKFCQNLLEEGASYSSIILSKDGIVLYQHSTNSDWEKIYHESGFCKSCHLFTTTKLISKQKNNFTLFWDLLEPNNEISAYLNTKRAEKNICHGVSFCNLNKNGVLEILTLAGRRCELNFASQVIDHKNQLQRHSAGLKEKYLTKKKFESILL